MGASPIEDVLPLVPLQEGLWFHATYNPEDDDVYVGLCVLALDGPLDAAVLRSSLEVMLRRYPNLRASFVQRASGELIQVITRNSALPWEEVDLTPLPADAVADELDRVVAVRARGRFDLARGPLMGFTLVKTGPEAHRLVIRFHHILWDGWSSSLFLSGLFACYRSGGTDVGLPIARDYRDYLRWLATKNLDDSEEAWRKALSGLAGPTLVAGTRLPHGGAAQEQLELRMTRADSERLVAFARAHDVTLNTAVQAAWAVLLARRTGVSDVTFGATVSGRPIELDGVEDMIGLFVNTIPVRVRVTPEQSVPEFLREVRDGQLEVVEHHHVPLSRIQRWVGVGPLFDTAVTFQNYPDEFEGLLVDGDLRVSVVSARERTHLPLTLQVEPGEEIRLEVNYRPDVLRTPVVEELVAFLRTVLVDLADGAQRPVGALAASSPATGRGAADEADRVAPRADADSGPAAVPRSRWEDTLCGLFADILGVPAVGVDDDFFALGGDSLHAIRLTSRIRASLGRDVRTHHVFDVPTASGLAVLLEGLPPGRAPLRPTRHP
ncbi:condensation domain-containing protein [Actinosynnema sp. NPDC020468]|uniref:condensation domain-containing protein n=1 Tax=Actinosynnema sp. NPDC020468 TaxID=3154488 RepID=UPI0033D386DD